MNCNILIVKDIYLELSNINKSVSVGKQLYREIRLNRSLIHASQSFSLIEKRILLLALAKLQLRLSRNVYNSSFSNFEKRVLDYCQSELQCHCDIRLDWTVEPQARKKVTSLNFQFKSTGKDTARSRESATAISVSNRRARYWITGDLSLLEE